jgi:hypothetical protein
MAVKLSVLRAGHPLPPGKLLALISVRVWVDPRAIVQLKGLGQLKNLVSSSGIEPRTFRLVAWCLNQLRFRVPPSHFIVGLRNTLCSFNMHMRTYFITLCWITLNLKEFCSSLFYLEESSMIDNLLRILFNVILYLLLYYIANIVMCTCIENSLDVSKILWRPGWCYMENYFSGANYIKERLCFSYMFLSLKLIRSARLFSLECTFLLYFMQPNRINGSERPNYRHSMTKYFELDVWQLKRSH